MGTAHWTERPGWRLPTVRWAADGWARPLVVAVFATLSVWVVSQDLLLVARHGGVWTGTDGLLAPDQMQHLAWVRDAAGHGLASNLFVTEPRPHDYIQPLVAISAVLTALGMAPWLAVLLWKPVAVAACVVAVTAVVRQTVEGEGARTAALALALLFAGWNTILAHAVDAHGIRWSAITNEIWLPFWTWGYPFAVISFAAMVGALCCYAADRAAGRLRWGAPLLGALSTWVHPWQGQTLILILLGAEAVMWRTQGRPRLAILAATVGATVLPLAYYLILGRVNESWRLAQEAGHRTWPLWILLLALAPLILPAFAAYRARSLSFLSVAIRVWPLAVLAVFLIAQTPRASGALHAVLGVTVPLGVLAVEGVRSLRFRPHPLLVAAAIVALVGPPVYEQLRSARGTLKSSYDGNFDPTFITASENDALNWLGDEPRPGAVLARAYLGAVVPARTGRSTWVGNLFWTPDPYARSAAADALFGSMPAEDSRRLARDSGATFVLADCTSRVPLAPRLGSMVAAVRRFGCARVVELRRPGS